MSLFTLFSGSQKNDAQRMQDAAHGRAVLGDVMGSSPYMREWRRQKNQISKDYRQQEKNVEKQWKKEDEDIQRELDKQKERHERRGAGKYFAQYETKHRREIQKERSKMLDTMERDRNKQIRNIGSTIRQFKQI